MISGSSTISFMGDYGVYMGDKVTKADLVRVMIEGNGKGTGTGIHAMGGNVMVSGGEIKKVQMGIAMSSGWLTVKDGTKIEFMGDYGVYVGSGVKSASLTRTVIRGNGKGKGTGVYAKGGTNLTMTLDKVEIKGVEMGVYMEKEGKSLTISGSSTIEFVGDGVGVGVWGEVKSVSLTQTVITGGGVGSMGVYAMGGGTLEMTLDDVRISKVAMGVVMGRGKSLMISRNSTINFMGEYGVYVGNGVTSAELNDVTITGKNKGMGIHAMGGTNLTMTLDKVDISQVAMGVYARGGKKLTMKKGSVDFTGNYGVGVYLGNTAMAELNDVTITGSGKGSTGVYAMGTENVKVGLTDVKIEAVEIGVMMLGKGNLTMENVTRISLAIGGGYGVMVGGDVTAELKDVKIIGGRSGKGMGVYGMGGTNLTMTLDKVEISKVEMGVMMLEGKSLTITGGSIKEVQTGVRVMGGKSLMIRENSRIEFMGGYGVMVGGEVTAELKGTTITGQDKGVGVIMESSGKMMLDKVGISKVKTGVYAEKGTLIIEKGTTIDFKESGWGVYVEKLVKSVNLNDVTIKGEESGMGTGVYAVGGAGNGELTISLEKVEISKVGKGVYARGGKSLMIRGTTEISFMGEYGVKVEGLVSTYLTKTRIVGTGSERGRNNGVSVGVYAVGGGIVTLEGVDISGVQTGVSAEGSQLTVTLSGGVKISNVRTGVAMTGSGTLAVEDGTKIEFKDGYGVMVGGVNARLTGAKIMGSGSGYGVYAMGGKVLLEKVTIEGDGKGKGTGLYMTRGAVRLKDTILRDVAKGMTISQGVVHMVGGSVTFSGRYGISVSGGNAFLSGFKITRQENKGTVAVAVEDTVANTVEDTVEGVGAGAGVEVSHSAKVMMKGVNIEGVKTGAYVMGNGFLVMGKGSISFKGDYGIYFDQGYAVLNDVHITGSGHKGTGIKMGYGQLLMVDTTLKEVAEGMTIVKGNVSMVGGSIEFKREHGVLLKQGSVLLNNLSMKYRGSNSDATFLKVEADSVVDKEGKRVLNTADIKGIGIKIDGQDKARGVYVNNGGRVMLLWFRCVYFPFYVL
ncbi:Right handed beta helix region [Bartonella schoenbuchensis R1]|uniref:Right handed beta helix region n=2 Tax=Bartonella schoenbuchensis TaxID=165694 RepID=A0A1S6XRF0_BARSR|nr:Right handed beta helix region [Bartonella schoenbuchensis R1]